MKHFGKLVFGPITAVDQGDLPVMMKRGENHPEKTGDAIFAVSLSRTTSETILG
jgi:hypothetical protein